MTSHPFQKSPTFGEYCAWLKSKGGSVESDKNEWGPFVRLSFPKGKRDGRAIETIDESSDERLSPTRLSQLDRRFGTKSPWSPEFDDGDDPDDD